MASAEQKRKLIEHLQKQETLAKIQQQKLKNQIIINQEQKSKKVINILKPSSSSSSTATTASTFVEAIEIGM